MQSSLLAIIPYPCEQYSMLTVDIADWKVLAVVAQLDKLTDSC